MHVKAWHVECGQRKTRHGVNLVDYAHDLLYILQELYMGNEQLYLSIVLLKTHFYQVTILIQNQMLTILKLLMIIWKLINR